MNAVQFCSRQGVYFIRLIGHLEFRASAGLDIILDCIKEDQSIKRVVVDLTYAQSIDSTNLGMIALLGLYSNQRYEHRPILCPGAAAQVKRTLSKLHLHQLYRWQGKNEDFGIQNSDFIELLLPKKELEARICDRAIEAHRALISLGERNKFEFRIVMAGLQLERALLEHEYDTEIDIDEDLESNQVLLLQELEVNKPCIRKGVSSQIRVH